MLVSSTHSKSQQEAGFAHTRITNQEQLEQVVTVRTGKFMKE